MASIKIMGYGLETGTLRLQRPRLVVVSRGPPGHDVTLGLGLGLGCKRRVPVSKP